MPSSQEHIAQAEHNEAAFAYLGAASPHYNDWQVTCLFYAALHYVDAFLMQVQPPLPGGRPSGHRQRGKEVGAHLGKDLYLDYYELQQRSEDARYDLMPFSAAQVTAWHSSEFDRLRTHIRATLGLPL